ncbi:MAG TPA: glycerophosphodiester phosphodiesterase family protein [Hyphomicrobiaceae bacterium]|jgi:glycerophosphoryl diester phosphodiesterase
MRIAMRAARRHLTGTRLKPAHPPLDRAVFVRPIAHRGWHDKTEARVENTAPAFRAAIAKGYGIECDLQGADDGTPMVFHDPALDRLVDGSGPLSAYSPRTLARLRYKGLDEKILSFAQLLDLVAGRVPLLVEVKRNGVLRPEFLAGVARRAAGYRGPVALMSFDRDTVTALGELAPSVPRGSVIGGRQLISGLWARRSRRRESPAASRLFASAPEGIAFYAVQITLVAVARTWMSRRAQELPLFTWTVRTPRQRVRAARWADAPIFEGYEA